MKIKKFIFSITLIALCLMLNACSKELYTVNFMVEGELYHTITVEEESKLTLPNNPTKEHYTFAGWVDELGNPISDNVIVMSNLTFNATFNIEKYKLIFNFNDGTNHKEEVYYDYNALVDEIDRPTRKGYTFKGWYLEDELYDFDRMPGEDVELMAKWELDDVRIAFNSNGGSVVASIYAKPGTAITAPANPTKKNCTFLGWYLGDELFTFDVMPSENIELVAKWEGIQYTITYELNDGTCDNLITTYSSDRKGNITLPTPTKDGYSFAGWYTKSSFNSIPLYILDSSYNRNITLHARWVSSDLKYKTFGVYGDSITTFEGFVPTEALFYYPIYSSSVKTVKQTWWKIVEATTGLALTRNISYSGSTVSSGYGNDYGSNPSRVSKLAYGNGESPDIIIIYLGINDVVNGVASSKFEEQYRKMINTMKSNHPNSQLVVCNLAYETYTDGSNPSGYNRPGLREEFNGIIEKIAKENSIPLVDLDKVITKETEKVNNWYYLGDNIHPSDKGMQVIAEAVIEKINELLK